MSKEEHKKWYEAFGSYVDASIKMNKQQLIDTAIDEMHVANLDKLIDFNKGKWTAPYDICECNGDILGIFTRTEFEARKAERDKEKHEDREMMLGMINSFPKQTQQHWYDYENQKALRLPPIGEDILYCEMLEDDYLAKVIAINGDEAVCDVGGRYRGLKLNVIKPLDWDKEIAEYLNPLLDLLKSLEFNSHRSLAFALLAAGYRKCDNKTPSDKE